MDKSSEKEVDSLISQSKNPVVAFIFLNIAPRLEKCPLLLSSTALAVSAWSCCVWMRTVMIMNEWNVSMWVCMYPRSSVVQLRSKDA